MDKFWKDLQNGSDIRGIAMEGIKGEEVNLTEEVASKIGLAFAEFLSSKFSTPVSKLTISIGMDSRLSGPALGHAIINKLVEAGCDVEDYGIASTPAMFMSTITEGYRVDGAIMLTASHLIFNRNGLKFFTSSGGLEKNDVTSILELASNSSAQSLTEITGSVRQVDFMSVYAAQIISNIRQSVNAPDFEHPLKGFKIVVDAGNGAGGFFVEKILKPLGADTTGSCFLDPDGNFPNHIPNPENQQAMDAIVEASKNSHAQLGIIFDTDVDRAAVVDEYGKQINRNRLVALMAAIVLEEHPASTIVTDSITSDGITDFIENDLRGIHHRFMRGYKNVINEAVRLNAEGRESWLAIETSGHAAMRENYFLDDGAYMVSKILIKQAQLMSRGDKLGSLIGRLNEPKESMEFRLKIEAGDFSSYGKEVIESIKSLCNSAEGWILTAKNFEGIRISCKPGFGSGWFLLRLSLHDPVLPLNVESNESGGIEQIMSRLAPELIKFRQLNCTSILNYQHDNYLPRNV
jgi:phosphomannomutase